MQYTSKSAVEDYLALTISPSLADAIASWIEAASNYIYQVTGRDFTPPETDADDTTKVYDGNGTEKLNIEDVLSVSKLTVDGVEISPSSYFLYPANRTPKTQIQLATGLARNSRQVLNQTFYTFTDSQQNVTVTGKHGYAEEIPANIQLAATKLVGGIIKESVGDKDVKELTSETFSDYSANYAKLSEIAHALNVDQLLAPYMREGKAAKTAIIGL
jgi:hypothetical protein